MDINWRAVGYGFITAIVIGLISGLGLPYTDASLPILGAGLTGLIAGFVSGYFAGGDLWYGFVHGALGTTIGALIVNAILTIFGILVAGIFGLGAGLVVFMFILVAAIPGAVGGAIGSVAKKSSAERAGKPAA